MVAPAAPGREELLELVQAEWRAASNWRSHVEAVRKLYLGQTPISFPDKVQNASEVHSMIPKAQVRLTLGMLMTNQSRPKLSIFVPSNDAKERKDADMTERAFNTLWPHLQQESGEDT